MRNSRPRLALSLKCIKRQQQNTQTQHVWKTLDVQAKYDQFEKACHEAFCLLRTCQVRFLHQICIGPWSAACTAVTKVSPLQQHLSHSQRVSRWFSWLSQLRCHGVWFLLMTLVTQHDLQDTEQGLTEACILYVKWKNTHFKACKTL